MAAPNPLPPDVNIHWMVDTFGWIGTGIATALVACRVFTRCHLMKSASWGDVVLVIAMIFCIIATSMQTVAGRYGAGRHVYYLTVEQIQRASLFGTVAVPFVQMAICLPKIATAAVLIRIADPIAGLKTRWYFYTITIGLCILEALYCIVIFVQCTPVFALWTRAPDAKCWSPTVVASFSIVSAVLSAFVDINLALYPIVIMRRLQMPRRRKITICVLMGLGATATICAVLKIPHLRDQVSRDVTWSIIDLVIYTLCEANLLLISACVPMLRPLLRWLSGKPVNSSTRATSPSDNAVSRQASRRRQQLKHQIQHQLHEKDHQLQDRSSAAAGGLGSHPTMDATDRIYLGSKAFQNEHDNDYLISGAASEGRRSSLDAEAPSGKRFSSSSSGSGSSTTSRHHHDDQHTDEAAEMITIHHNPTPRQGQGRGLGPVTGNASSNNNSSNSIRVDRSVIITHEEV